MIKKTMPISQGDIFLVRLPRFNGSVQYGTRPCLVVSNNKCNMYSNVIHVAPISSRVKKKKLPTHVHLDESVIGEESVIMMEQIQLVPKGDILTFVNRIPYDDKIKDAINIQFNEVTYGTVQRTPGYDAFARKPRY